MNARPTPRRACLIVVLVAIALDPVAARADDGWLARDKAAHLGATAGLAAGGYALASTATERRPWRLAVGGSLAVGAGVAKEIGDRSRGDASWRDLSWDLIGAATGLAIVWAIDRAHRRRRAPARGSGSETGGGSLR